MNEYKPYTYLVGWSELNKWYYGSQYCQHSRIANPKNLWTTYFTSSETVKEYRKLYGEPDVIQIRKTFLRAEAAILWEYKVLKRLNKIDPFKSTNSKWLNRNIGGAIVLDENQRKKSDEHKKKIGFSNKGKKKKDTSKMGKYKRTEDIKNKMVKSRIKNDGYRHSEETKIKIGEKSQGGKASLGYKHTEEAKLKMSESKKGTPSHRKGKSMPDEAKKIISEKLKGRESPRKGSIASEETKLRMSLVRKGRPANHIKGKKKYTDGNKIKLFNEGEQPIGWIKTSQIKDLSDIS